MKDRRIFSSNKLIYSYLKQTLDKTEWDNQEWTIKSGQFRVDNQEWTIQSGQSRVDNQVWTIKSGQSRVDNSETLGKQDTGRTQTKHK
jgi:hypothetical protein